MKEFAMIFIALLINAIAIVLMTHRERVRTRIIRDRAEKERAEILEDAKKKIKKMQHETQQFKDLLELFNERITLYNSNPKKFCTYKDELLEWYEKIAEERYKCIEVAISNDNFDIPFQNLLTMLKQFAEWTEGKIE